MAISQEFVNLQYATIVERGDRREWSLPSQPPLPQTQGFLCPAHSQHRFAVPSSKLARFSYATEGALIISVQLSSDVVSALRKVQVLIKL